MTIKLITTAITVEAAAYATGELLGGKLTFSNALPGNYRAVLRSVQLVDQANQKVDIDLVLFSSDPSGTTFTENSALDIADADLLKVVGRVSIDAADYVSFADNALATKEGLALPIEGKSNTFYGALVCRGAPTYAAVSDLQLTLALEV